MKELAGENIIKKVKDDFNRLDKLIRSNSESVVFMHAVKINA